MCRSVEMTHGYETRQVEEEDVQKEVSHVPPNEGARSFWVFGEVLTQKIPSTATGGAYALFEAATPPGAGPPPHVQHREDEAFYVLEGKYEFLLGSSTTRAEEGSLLYVPKGTLHAHANVGEGVGRILVSQTPGGLFEHYFEEVGEEAPSNVVIEPLEEDSSEAARITAVAARYGIEIALPTERARPLRL